MKNSKSTMCFIMSLMLALFPACSTAEAGPAANTIIQMEMTAEYDSSDPFINEQLFCVTDQVETLDLEFTFQLQGASGLLEIADNETKEVLWSNAWNEDVAETTFTVTLTSLDKEKEYVVRLTGTEIDYAEVTVTSENSLVQQRARPQAKS